MTDSILIATKDDTAMAHIRTRCQCEGYDTKTVESLLAALTEAEGRRPIAVIVDTYLVSSGLTHSQFLLKFTELHSSPVIFLVSDTQSSLGQQLARLEASCVIKNGREWPAVKRFLDAELGIVDDDWADDSDLPDTLLKSPCEDFIDGLFLLLKQATSVSRPLQSLTANAEPVERPWILSIEDDDDFAEVLRLRLNDMGIDVVRAEAGTTGYRKAFFEAPRAILLDFELPDGNADYVMRRLKETPATWGIPVIILTGRRDGYIERQMRDMGVSAYITKPVDWEGLRLALSHHIEVAGSR